jgi:predicted DNA-binding transcriptional regulator AlpA
VLDFVVDRLRLTCRGGLALALRRMTMNEILDLARVDRTTVYDWMRRGLFPRDEAMRSRAKLWNRAKVETALARRPDRRRSAFSVTFWSFFHDKGR